MSRRIILPALPKADEDFWPNAVIDDDGHVYCPDCGGVDTMVEASLSQGGAISPGLRMCSDCDYVSGDDYGPAEFDE